MFVCGESFWFRLVRVRSFEFEKNTNWSGNKYLVSILRQGAMGKGQMGKAPVNRYWSEAILKEAEAMHHPSSSANHPAVLSDGCLCPVCENESVQRKKRTAWMRLISGSKYYYCEACKARFLQLSNRRWHLHGRTAQFGLNWPWWRQGKSKK